MLYVTIKNDHGEEQTRDWHVGDKFPFYRPEYKSVVELQADGDELSHIRSFVTMINDSNRPVVTWFGDDAKFIAANVKW